MLLLRLVFLLLHDVVAVVVVSGCGVVDAGVVAVAVVV